jgi:hypothetical protein
MRRTSRSKVGNTHSSTVSSIFFNSILTVYYMLSHKKSYIVEFGDDFAVVDLFAQEVGKGFGGLTRD